MRTRKPCPKSSRPLFPAALASELPLLLLASLLTAPASAQRDFSEVVIKPVPVAGHVSMLEGSGGNIGVSVGPDGVLIVDDQFEPLADRILAALNALDGTGSGVPRFVLNTHFHGDHTGGNAVFGRDGTIIAQVNVRTRLAAGQQRGGRVIPPAPPQALPVITFEQSLAVNFNGEEIRVLHLPHGHTDGDCVVWFTGSNVLHMGDHFFTGRFPFIDLDSGGDVAGFTRNVGAILELVPADIRIIPGHGPVSSIEDLRAFHQMLLTTTALVRERMAEGSTPEQIAADGLPAEWAEWGSGFISAEAWLATLQRSLAQPVGAEPGSTPATPAPPRAPGSDPADPRPASDAPR